MNGTFLLKKNLKDIRTSFFERGFAIPVDKQAAMSCYLRGGRLSHGERRIIKFILDGKAYDVVLRSVGFSRKKFPHHSEMWQINWRSVDVISEAVKKIFAKSYHDDAEDGEYFLLYSTNTPDTFYIEPVFKREIIIPKISEVALENLLESPFLTSREARLIEQCRLSKLRKMTLSLGEQLKRVYDYRCQICGRSVGVLYGVSLAECHHITPFAESLDNDAANLLIVCPNHHRIIHTAKPTFDRERKLYLYPNGYKESLTLNEHL